MKPEFYTGYTVYRNPHPKRGLVFVVLHSGPALETPTSRDDNAGTVASLCALYSGGHLVTSGISRKITWGVDFNRDIPEKEKAIEHYPLFIKDVEKKKLKKYRKRYAWAAKNTTDHNKRLKMYRDFWSGVKGLGNFYIIVHRKYCRIKNYPSVMDIATFRSKGIDDKVLKAIVDDINGEKDFFNKVERVYKDAVLLEQTRVVDRVERIFGEFDLKRMKIEYKENIKNDIKTIKKWADKKFIKRLEKNFNKTNFMSATRNALKNAPQPGITMDTIFKGDMSYGPRKQLNMGNGNIVMQIEINEFFSKFYPNEAAEIICDIINKIKNVKKYKSLGLSQTQIVKFLKND